MILGKAGVLRCWRRGLLHPDVQTQGTHFHSVTVCMSAHQVGVPVYTLDLNFLIWKRGREMTNRVTGRLQMGSLVGR